jgi:uncharacterized membrane protein
LRNSVERALKLGPVVAPIALAVVALGLDFALAKPGHTADFVTFVGRFHPLVVHLPIGFLLLVAFAEALTFVPRWRSRIDPALALLWPALAASAVLAFALGLLLAHDGGYPDRLVTLHRRLTLAAVLAIALNAALWTRVEQGRLPRAAYRGVLVAALGLLSLGAHQGGSLSRGENYLFELAPSFVRNLLRLQAPAPAVAVKKAEPTAEPLVFADVVAPIFRERCVSCHGAEKQKGGLRLDSFENLKKGGKNGPELTPADAAHSRLVTRLTLPLADDERMPPEDKPQPTPGEVEIIKWWIDRGASDTLRVRDTLAPDAARALLIHSAVASGATELGIASPNTPVTGPATQPAQPTSASSSAASSPPSSGNAAPEPAASAPPTTDQRALFPAVIAPLLASRCGKCHGAEKQKGRLRTDSQAALIAGGKNGHGVVPGDPARGTVLARLALPMSDDQHMPPEEEPQLTASQISLLKWWVGAGANSETPAVAAPAALVASARNMRAAPRAPATPPTNIASDAATRATPDASASHAPLDPIVLASLPATIRLYQDVVKPMLGKLCGDCHGGNDPDGDLRIDDYAHLLASKAVVPGKPKQSELVVRTRLPVDKSRHMPPAVSSQPEPAELDALELWIAQGATEDATIQAASLPVSVADLVQRMLPSVSAPPTSAVAAAPAPATATAVTPPETAKSPPNTEALAALTPTHGGCAACAVSLQERNSPLPIALALLVGSTFLLRRRA